MSNPIMAEFFGIMAGDGCLSHTGKSVTMNWYWVYICGHKIDDKNHYDYIKNLIKILFNRDVKVYEKNKQNAVFISIKDKLIFESLAKLGLPIGKKYEKLHIPKWICGDEKNARSFLRGLFDTDGCFVLSKQRRKIKYYPRIEIATKSDTFGREIVDLLKKLKIKSSFNKKAKFFRIEVAGIINVNRWMETIGSNNQKHIKKYSYWKENLLHLCGSPHSSSLLP